MSRQSVSAISLPPQAAKALGKLGADLALARVRRNESQKVWAERIGVSVPTLIRMERGDPGVSMAVYATALWIVGRSKALEDLAAPEHDSGALEMDVRGARARMRRRARATEG